MTERLLQYIWQFQYFNKSHLQTQTSEPLQIIFPGSFNTNQGPDFTNARIKIGNAVFAGSVELHVKTSQWFQHGHQNDANYNNVILHVVYEDDIKDSALPVLELQPLISTILLERYNFLMGAGSFISCASSIQQVKDITWTSWKERLLVERLTRKAQHILLLFDRTNPHWEETFWRALARNFGMKVNADPFEAIAESIPVNLLAKHKQQIHHLEALLFGQAGLLQNDFNEEYPRLLKREYQFLQAKYRLKPVAQPVHFLRMRPMNFPTVRLAQLAALVQTSAHLFSRLLEIDKASELKTLFDVTANDYWHYHYRFDEASAFKPKKLGEDMVSNIIINTVVPVVFAYGLYHNKEPFKTRSIRWLEEIRAEQNVITKGFAALDIANKSAFDSQALIELKNEYCTVKRCLQCAVGNAILKST